MSPDFVSVKRRWYALWTKAPGLLRYNPCGCWKVLQHGTKRQHDSRAGPEPQIERAYTLPSSFYIDPKFQEEEKHNIFHRTWQIVGRREQVSKPGDYFTANLCGEPLLIVRDTENKLRGHYNVVVIARDHPPKVADREKYFAVAITVGPTVSMDAC